MAAVPHLATYLNDHLAGAVAGLELLGHLERASDVADFAAALYVEVMENRRKLESLIDRLGISQSSARQASAWLMEKFTRAKIRLDDLAGCSLHLLESLEALSLGIEGKRLLWLSLASAAETDPSLAIADYTRLTRRAEDQRGRVEQRRIAAAHTALAA